jgi:uncharacterized protein (DUF2252 family)
LLSVIERIKEFNSNRLPEYLLLKYRAMAQDPFYFFRGTAHLFYEDLAHANVITAHPLTWVCGDLHIENFGSYKGDNRLVYFDINDFDEAALAPASWELVRMVSSIFTALLTMGASYNDARHVAEIFLKTYAAALAKGRSRYIEPQVASGIVKTFLHKVADRRQKDLVNERTEKQNGRLVLEINNKRLFAINATLKAHLCHHLQQWFKQQPTGHRQYRVTDAAFRIAGTGSIGVKRYAFLVERLDVKGKYLLMDMKQAMPAAICPFIPVQQPAWTSEAERVVAVQERMQNSSPALLAATVFENESFVVKEMQPTADKIDFTTLRHRYNDIKDLIEDMALLTASAQLRSSGRQGAANADDLMAFGRDTSWMPLLIAYAGEYAHQVKKDYQEYFLNYNAGYFFQQL